MPWSVVTIVPTSTTARPAVFRPALEIGGKSTLLLVDQIRSLDLDYVHGDPVHYLDHDEMSTVEHALTCYLGLGLDRPKS